MLAAQRRRGAASQAGRRYTPTPAISHAILDLNRGRTTGLADGIVITPSHNPPEDGGFKYNPPDGGPADTDVTDGGSRTRANALLAGGLASVQPRRRSRRRCARRPRASTTSSAPYVADLGERRSTSTRSRGAKLRIGVDPLGGAVGRLLGRRSPSATACDLDGRQPGRRPDVRVHDRRPRRQDPHGLLVAVRDGQPDRRSRTASTSPSATTPTPTATASSRPSAGLMNPNHYLAVAIEYLFRAPARLARATRRSARRWSRSSMIDRVAARLGRRLAEVPVGFKWFVDGLLDGSLGFGGEESAGASFLRSDGTVWTTDKDGILLDLLAAEIRAVTGKDPGELYRELDGALRRARLRAHRRAGDAASRRRALGKLSPDARDGRRRSPASRSSRGSRARPATTRRSAGSRSSPRTAGSRRGRRAPRTSTRSTRRASGAATTWRASRRRRARSSRPRSGRSASAACISAQAQDAPRALQHESRDRGADQQVRRARARPGD